MTGIRDFSIVVLIRSAPPLGINTSMYSRMVMSSSVSLRLVELMICTASDGTCVGTSASRRTLQIATFEWIASEPPRKMTALPDLIQMPAESDVTLGRDSYMTPITPIGTRTWLMIKPLGRVQVASTVPIGSSSAATSRSSFAIF